MASEVDGVRRIRRIMQGHRPPTATAFFYFAHPKGTVYSVYSVYSV
jgi:hypothetical protein